MNGKGFDDAFGAQFLELLRWRRDVRHFKTDPIPDATLDALIAATQFSPSVGYSQPWRFVAVETPSRRKAVIASFERSNADALDSYGGADALLYASLKLSGLREAPVHLAIFCHRETPTGKGLGSQTMPQTLDYSCVMAIYTFWLAARTHNIGVGWVSILDPAEIHAALDVPEEWNFIGYLCVGYPASHAETPELQRAGWETPDERSRTLERR